MARRPLTPDQRLHVRLEALAQNGSVALSKALRDRGAIVAELALVAPGRADIAESLIDELRHPRYQPPEDWPPRLLTLALVEAARRVMLGDAALVAPGGWRVQQITTERHDIRRTLLRTTRNGQLVVEARTVEELAQHVDPTSLAEEVPDEPVTPDLRRQAP
jgi:hypothetical protein